MDISDWSILKHSYYCKLTTFRLKQLKVARILETHTEPKNHVSIATVKQVNSRIFELVNCGNSWTELYLKLLPMATKETEVKFLEYTKKWIIHGNQSCFYCSDTYTY